MMIPHCRFSRRRQNRKAGTLLSSPPTVTQITWTLQMLGLEGTPLFYREEWERKRPARGTLLTRDLAEIQRVAFSYSASLALMFIGPPGGARTLLIPGFGYSLPAPSTWAQSAGLRAQQSQRQAGL